jgi:hypothetical protein
VLKQIQSTNRYANLLDAGFFIDGELKQEKRPAKKQAF